MFITLRQELLTEAIHKFFPSNQLARLSIKKMNAKNNLEVSTK